MYALSLYMKPVQGNKHPIDTPPPVIEYVRSKKEIDRQTRRTTFTALKYCGDTRHLLQAF
jgi:hypothetical protein